MLSISLISPCMKYSVLFFVVLLAIFSWGQKPVKLPKKLCGMYEGMQASYVFTHHGETITMDSISVAFDLRKTTGDLCYVNPNHCMVKEGSYQSCLKQKEGKSTKWVVVFSSTAGSLPEELWMYPKTRKLIRLGVFPQPNVTANKLREK